MKNFVLTVLEVISVCRTLVVFICPYIFVSIVAYFSSASSDVSIPPWADPLQIFYTGEDPLCDLVLEGLGLSDAELPMIAIVDVIGGRMCVCEKPDVSAEIVAEFVAEYKSGKVHMTPLPSSCQVSSPTNSFSEIFFLF